MAFIGAYFMGLIVDGGFISQQSCCGNFVYERESRVGFGHIVVTGCGGVSCFLGPRECY